MNKKIELIASTLLGVMMIVFGLNKFLGFIAVEPPSDPIAQQFLGVMFSSYLYILVGIVEVIGGLLLLIPRFRFVGWLLQGTIILNIVAFHIAHDFIGNGIWILPSILFLILGYFQLENIKHLFNGAALRGSAFGLLLLSSLNLSAQSNDYISIKVENSIIVEEASEQVWGLISDVENLSLLVNEVIEKVEKNGNGLNSSWTIHLRNGRSVTEEMTYFNSEEMEFSYVMTETPMPLSHYWAIQKVEELDAQKSKVSFTTYFNTNLENSGSLRTTFTDFQNTFLQNIKKNIQ